MHWLWNIGCVYISLCVILLGICARMKDSGIKLLIVYLIVEFVIKPILLSTLDEDFKLFVMSK